MKKYCVLADLKFQLKNLFFKETRLFKILPLG